MTFTRVYVLRWNFLAVIVWHIYTVTTACARRDCHKDGLRGVSVCGSVIHVCVCVYRRAFSCARFVKKYMKELYSATDVESRDPQSRGSFIFFESV